MSMNKHARRAARDSIQIWLRQQKGDVDLNTAPWFVVADEEPYTASRGVGLAAAYVIDGTGRTPRTMKPCCSSLQEAEEEAAKLSQSYREEMALGADQGGRPGKMGGQR